MYLKSLKYTPDRKSPFVFCYGINRDSNPQRVFAYSPRLRNTNKALHNRKMVIYFRDELMGLRNGCCFTINNATILLWNLVMFVRFFCHYCLLHQSLKLHPLNTQPSSLLYTWHTTLMNHACQVQQPTRVFITCVPDFLRRGKSSYNVGW